MAVHRPPWEYDEEFDGGEVGCGELLIDLRLRFRDAAPGTKVLVIAKDEAAPTEIPAWCRLTGHHLDRGEYPFYLIIAKRKGES